MFTVRIGLYHSIHSSLVPHIGTVGGGREKHEQFQMLLGKHPFRLRLTRRRTI
jgi:hypothetical protein